MKRLILFLSSITFIGLVVGFYFYTKKPTDIRSEQADFTLTAKELIKEFDENETAASAKYIDKVLIVSGKIDDINLSSATVFLKGESPINSVTCSFYEDEKGKLSMLKKDDDITIKGKCTGKLMDVVLNNCSLVNASNP